MKKLLLIALFSPLFCKGQSVLFLTTYCTQPLEYVESRTEDTDTEVEVVSEKYWTITGYPTDKTQVIQGQIYIARKEYNDGSVEVVKIVR